MRVTRLNTILDPELKGFIGASEKEIPMEIKRLTAACMGLWFDPFAVQGTFKRLLQHHNLKPSILQCSAFFMDQFSHLYLTIGKTIALTMWTIVSKVMSLLLKMLSGFVVAFLPRSKHQ